MVQGPVRVMAGDGAQEVAHAVGGSRCGRFGSLQPAGMTRVVAEPAGKVVPAGAVKVKTNVPVLFALAVAGETVIVPVPLAALTVTVER